MQLKGRKPHQGSVEELGYRDGRGLAKKVKRVHVRENSTPHPHGKGPITVPDLSTNLNVGSMRHRYTCQGPEVASPGSINLRRISKRTFCKGGNEISL
jgi:hypothetical protein